MTLQHAARSPAQGSRPKVKDGEAGQIGAPMPGRVVSVAVEAGQAVSRGDGLITIEAMKMETTVFAEADGKVGEIHVAPGDEVETKDLLLEIELS